MPAPQTEVVVIVAGCETGRFVFTPGDYLIGCGPDSHIRVDAPSVSRRHAKLTLNFDNALIEDLGSDGGTQVNGKPIPKGGRTRLWPSQKIQVGAATIELRRLKADSDPDRTLAPTQEVVKRVLPEAFLREKKYDIGGVVAQGGMGAILDAKEATIERTVAMKVMLDSNAPDDLLRFLNEAKITGQLEHPNIVPVHELSVDENGQPFYTMKFVKGITLRKVLEKMAAERGQESGVRSQASDAHSSLTPDSCPLTPSYPLPVLLTIFQKVCDALAFAHSRGVIHRDLKPENIMVGDYGEVLLMDWGLAKRLRNTEPGAGKDGSAPPEEDIRTIRHSVAEEMPATAVFDPAALASTMAGTIMGTPQYMAPEQARGEVETMDQRADIYSLGAILYHILALRPPVTGRDSMEVVGKVARGEIEPLECAGPPAPFGVRQPSGALAGAERRGGPDDPPQAHGKPTTAPPPSAKRQRAGALQKGRAPHRAIPASLAAVVRKAIALDKAARYRCVEELQADILAYQTGFATSAENAGAWKQFTLLVKRHKAASIGIAAVLLVGSVLGTKTILEGRRAERGEALAKSEAKRALNEAVRAERGETEARATLAELRSTAPNFIDQAATLVTANDLPGALKKATAATKLVPDVAEYRIFRAHLLFAIPNLRDAADEYRQALALHPDIAEAREHLALCEALLKSEPDSAKLSAGSLKRIHALTIQYGRSSHAVYLLRELQGERKQLLATWRKVLEDHGILAPFQRQGAVDLRLNDDGTFWLKVSQGATDLSALRGMPVTGLVMEKTKVVDLRPLSALPLRTLNISNTRPADFEPLRGLKLEVLSLVRTGIESLEPLRGMPLRKLLVSGDGKISDLSPLRGMPLEELEINDASPVSLEPLSSLPLKKLRLYAIKTPIDISPLHNLPIEDLTLGQSRIKDYAPLSGMRLKKFDAHLSPGFGDISLLSEMPLEELFLVGTDIKSLDPLSGAPLRTLDISGTKVSDLSPLKGMVSLKALRAVNCQSLHDLAPLAGLPLEFLHLPSIRAELDLAPLLDCPNLRELTLPAATRNLQKLRQHPSLQWLSERYDYKDGNAVHLPTQTAAEFWKEYDAMTPAEKEFREARGKNFAQVAAALPALGMAEGKATIVEPWGIRLLIEGLPVTDISGLRALPIDALSLFETKVANLAPLRGMRLKELSFAKTDVKDVSPLLDMPILEAAMVPQGATNLEVLRDHPTLQWLGWEGDWDKDANRPKLTTAEFWARYDEQQAAGKK